MLRLLEILIKRYTFVIILKFILIIFLNIIFFLLLFKIIFLLIDKTLQRCSWICIITFQFLIIVHQRCFSFTTSPPFFFFLFLYHNPCSFQFIWNLRRIIRHLLETQVYIILRWLFGNRTTWWLSRSYRQIPSIVILGFIFLVMVENVINNDATS